MNGELVAALDGNWIEVEKAVGQKIKAEAQPRGVELTSEEVQQATRDSVKALMMIRAYRMRGHLHARLDPLELEPQPVQPELDPASYGFTEADLDRKIFIDYVLGLEFASVREMVAILSRTYCQTMGIEFMRRFKSWPTNRSCCSGPISIAWPTPKTPIFLCMPAKRSNASARIWIAENRRAANPFRFSFAACPRFS